MSRRAQLVVMARQPRFGMGKRRLAAGCGERAAWRFQRDNLALLVRRLGHDPRWQLRLALVPDAVRAPVPAARRLPRHVQCRGDLGQRILAELCPHPPGLPAAPRLVIGGDIAGVHAVHIARALRALRSHDWVIGPAEDGGFWLIGASGRHPRPPDFTGIAWGTDTACAAVLERLPGRHAFADRLFDVDEADDFLRWRRAG
ncbi:DUF2064 domain-containing protein [Fodinicurvata halophila]|uniref:DUF2064 domain-containing protein n=1 Tax=Fodinicurvata halophila TaxID=1419723 RepID=A0ABV8UJ21_9PROT